MYNITEKILIITWVNSNPSANLVFARNSSNLALLDILFDGFFLATMREIRIKAVMNASVTKRIVARFIVCPQIFVSQTINNNILHMHDTACKDIFSQMP